MQPFCVLMFAFNLDDVEEQRGANFGLTFKFSSLEVLRPPLVENGGCEMEPELWLFGKAEDALKGAVELRRSVGAFNQKQKDPLDCINITGYGLHVGTLLLIDGTDIHWGDPVNTASKLGQDLAEGGDILLTPAVKDAIESGSLLSQVAFAGKELQRSNVTFQCFSVLDTAVHERQN